MCRPAIQFSKCVPHFNLYISTKRRRIVAKGHYHLTQRFSSISGDPFAYYRTPSSALWNELDADNERTIGCIDYKLRMQLEKEISNIHASVPDPVPELGPTGTYVYFAKDIEGGTRVYRRRNVATNHEQTILEISFQQFQLHAMSLSVDESMIAYLVSSVLDSTSTIYIRHMDSQREIEVPAYSEEIMSAVEWGPIQGNGDHSLFFTTRNNLHRPHKVHVCTVSKRLKLSTTMVVYSNDDEAVMVDIQRTKGCRYVAISARTKTSNEIHLAGNLSNNLILVRARQPGIQYSLDVGTNDNVWIVANASVPNHDSGLGEEMTIFETSIDVLPLKDTFGTLRAESEEFIIHDIDLFQRHVVYYQYSVTDGKQRMRFDNLATGNSKIIDLPGGSSSILLPGGNIFYNASSLRFGVENAFSKGSVYECNFDTGTTMELSSSPTGQNQRYMQQRVLVTSQDGTRVPLTLVHCSSIDPFGPDEYPAVLHGYGAYGEPVMRGFDAVTVSLLDRGFVIAFAHTRGGGELGRAWYRAGRLYEKRNSIDDFLVCAEYLIENVTAPSLLTAKAFSAGGVVVGAAINERPELFGSVVFTNAFLDVSSSLNPLQPLTEHEYEEWGNPMVDPTAALLIASYCPFSNITPSIVYPRALIIGTLDDENVPFWHAVTFQRKYQHLKSQQGDSRGALIYTVPCGGHHLHGVRLEVESLETAFIVDNIIRVKSTMFHIQEI